MDSNKSISRKRAIINPSWLVNVPQEFIPYSIYALLCNNFRPTKQFLIDNRDCWNCFWSGSGESCGWKFKFSKGILLTRKKVSKLAIVPKHCGHTSNASQLSPPPGWLLWNGNLLWVWINNQLVNLLWTGNPCRVFFHGNGHFSFWLNLMYVGRILKVLNKHKTLIEPIP